MASLRSGRHPAAAGDANESKTAATAMDMHLRIDREIVPSLRQGVMAMAVTEYRSLAWTVAAPYTQRMTLCPNCGEENPEKAKFCAECGTALHLIRPNPPTEERKVVTILFCDVVGFTAHSDAADPEDVRARIRPFHQRVRQEIERFGGTVEKFIGDAVMAVFGAPVVHEDDPERAVRSALRILEAIDDLNEEEPSLALSVRIGINTGEAVVALGASPEAGEGMVTGDVVNTASRLQTAAPIGGIAVGEATHEATRELFDYLALEPVGVKGKAEPVAIWRPTAATARFGTDPTRKLASPLVGRRVELGILTSTFERSLHDRSVHLLTIVGEPGVGKSRLVAELFRFIDASPELVRWRQGRCLPYGDGVSFWALAEIVKAESGVLETDAPEVAGAKVDAIIASDYPDATWLRQRLRPLVGSEGPPATREENFAAWRVFLELLAERNPSVFVFEDLHWADDALLAFINYMVEYSEGVPMLLVGTARPELFEKAAGFAQAARNSNRINLSPLSETESASLIRNLLEQAVLPTEIQSTILSRSGGNPLFTEQFVRLLRDRQIIVKQGASWKIDVSAEIPTPFGVESLIAARLDTLGQEKKQLLADAAVVGEVFWLDAVAAMGKRDPKQVGQALHELARKELVRLARHSSMAGHTEYAFYHALVQDVCYAQIPRASRADRHLQAASWIEEIAGGRVDDHADVLAAHYLTALELVLASGGPGANELSSRARHYLALAGDRALGIDGQAAERNYALALKFTKDDDPARPALLLKHGDALRERGRFREAALAYEHAIEGFAARDDVPAKATAMGRHSINLWRLGDSSYAEVSARALELLEPLGPSPELAAAITEEAAVRFVVGDNHAAIAFANRAISLAEQLNLAEPVRALGFRGGARAVLGDAAGLEDMRRALDGARAQGLGRETVLIQNHLSEVLWPIKGPRARLEVLQESAAFAERRGLEEYVLTIAAWRVETLVNLGSYEEALALAVDLLPRLENAEDAYSLISVRAAQVRAFTRRGQFREAERLAPWTIDRAREIGGVQFITKVMLPAAALHLAVGDSKGALGFLHELRRIPNIHEDIDCAANLADAVRIALAAASPNLAARLIAGFEPLNEMKEHTLTTVRALLKENDDSPAEAAELFADAASGWERFEMPWEWAHALLGRGRCLLALGRATEATESLGDAREVFVRLGSRPLTTETAIHLERAIQLSS
jgi:class 3 adenylate cyclase/tetratricopeptide (TPR) repeat protein